MQHPTIDTTPLITSEDVAEINRKIEKRALRNLLIFLGVKAVVIYGVHRWAKSIDKNS